MKICKTILKLVSNYGFKIGENLHKMADSFKNLPQKFLFFTVLLNLLFILSLSLSLLP